MLRVCDGSGRHEEVVHNSNNCPLCNAIAEWNLAAKKQKEAEKRLEEVEANLRKVLG